MDLESGRVALIHGNHYWYAVSHYLRGLRLNFHTSFSLCIPSFAAKEYIICYPQMDFSGAVVQVADIGIDLRHILIPEPGMSRLKYINLKLDCNCTLFFRLFMSGNL